MVGRLYTIEDEIDVIHEDLGRARRHYNDMLRAEHDGRMADEDEHRQELTRATRRVHRLEAELSEALAERRAAEECCGDPDDCNGEDERIRTAVCVPGDDPAYEAEFYSGLEYGTDQPCQIGRLTYKVGAYDYVALAFRLTDPQTDWRLTWIGYDGQKAVRLPPGIVPSNGMLAALACGAVS